jgi:regulator of RNase E activity RraA
VERWEVLRYGHEVLIGSVRVATGDYLIGDRAGARRHDAGVSDRAGASIPAKTSA